MERTLSIDRLEELLSGAPFAGSPELVSNEIRTLHHWYLETRLTGRIPSSPAEWQRAEKVAHYLLTVMTHPLRVKAMGSPQLVEDGLAVAGTVFEYLGDLATELGSESGLEESSFYYLRASICDSLGAFEANSAILARKLLSILGVADAKGGSEPHLWREQARRWWIRVLAREFDEIWAARAELGHTADDIAKWIQGTVATTDAPTAVATGVAVELIYAVIAISRAFVLGDGKGYDDCYSRLEGAAQMCQDTGDYESLWEIERLRDVVQKMWRTSVWVQLRGHVPEAYLSELTRGPNPMFELWSSQLKALRLSGRSGGYLDPELRRIVLNMPTSAGKTLLAEIALASALLSDSLATCIYVVPTRALARQVEQELGRRLRAFGVRVSTIVGSYDVDFMESLFFEQTRVAVLTPEKLDMLARRAEEFVNRCALIVFDEIHKISSPGRGWTLESVVSWFLLSPRLRNAKMIFMSAVMPNALEVREWVDPDRTADPMQARRQPTRVLKAVCGFAAVPPPGQMAVVPRRLIYAKDRSELKSPCYIDPFFNTTLARNRDGKRDSNRSDSFIFDSARAAARFARLGSVLVYLPTVNYTRIFCRHIVEDVEDFPGYPSADLERLAKYIERRLGAEYPLARFVRKGVAFHHGRLPLDVRSELEDAFKKGHVRVLAATTTLAEGVNLPVDTLIISSTDYWMTSGKTELDIRDAANIMGRAGRAMLNTEGQVVVMLPVFSREDWRRHLFPSEHDLRIESSLQDLLSQRVLEGVIDRLEKGVEPTVLLEAAYLEDGQRDLVERLYSYVLLLKQEGIIDETQPQSFEQAFARTFAGTVGGEPATRALGAFGLASSEIVKKTVQADRWEVYKRSGLKLRTCNELYRLCEAFWRTDGRGLLTSPADRLSEGHLQEIARLALSVDELRPPEIKVGRGKNAQTLTIDHPSFLLDWMFTDASVSHLADKYFEAFPRLETRAEKTVDYLESELIYKAPWALSAFLLFSEHIMDSDPEAFGLPGKSAFSSHPVCHALALLPAYAKFGVGSPAAALFRAIGVPTRELATWLAGWFESEFPDRSSDYQLMFRWLFGLDPQEISDRFGADDAGELTRLFETLRSKQEALETTLLATGISLRFRLAGWRFNQPDDPWQAISEGDVVRLVREPDNRLDEHAVSLLHSRLGKIGYVPMAHSETVADALARGWSLECQVHSVHPPPTPTWERVDLVISGGPPSD